MLKGKSTIQLFDCKTGEKVKEVVNTNMVTNAISHLLNPPVNLMMGSNWLDTINKYLPLNTNGLAGIMAFDKNIPEDPNIIFPPADVNEVGHAGEAYSGTNTYRGSYNVNESGEIDGGYRHVWDFASDRANGTINCLALTSKAGGNCGLHYDSTSPNIYYQFTAMISNSTQYLGRISNNCFVQLSGNNTDNLNLLYNYTVDMSAITLNQKVSTSIIATETKKITVDAVNKSIKYNPDPNKSVVYLYNYTYTSATTCDIWYAAIDYSNNTKLYERTVTFTVPDIIYNPNNCAAVFSDYVYIVLYNSNGGNYKYTYHKYDIDGNYIGKFTNYDFSNGNFYVVAIGNKHYIIDNTTLYGNANEKLVSNTTDGFCRHCYDFQQQNISPFFLTSGYADMHAGVRIFQPYLGTINNLAESVTKTPAQTMKITYEITEG